MESETVKFPLTITGLKIEGMEMTTRGLGSKTGDWVAVRPCAKEYLGKTYLGVYLGDFPIGAACYVEQDGKLLVLGHQNPAIYIPDKKSVVWGCGSWWGEIKGPDDLKEITDKTIDDLWYVRALKELGESEKEEKAMA